MRPYLHEIWIVVRLQERSRLSSASQTPTICPDISRPQFQNERFLRFEITNGLAFDCISEALWCLNCPCLPGQLLIGISASLRQSRLWQPSYMAAQKKSEVSLQSISRLRVWRLRVVLVYFYFRSPARTVAVYTLSLFSS